MNITKAQLMVGCALLLACIALAQDALAQTTTSATSSATTTETTATQEPAVTTAASSPTAPLPTPLQVRLTNLTANMSNRTDALVVRFELIMLRMDARLTKMENEGFNTTDARLYMTEALISLGEAKQAASDLDEKVYTFVMSNNVADEWVHVRATYTDIKAQLLKTHELLLRALDSMKSSSRDDSVDTQTPQNASNTQSYAE